MPSIPNARELFDGDTEPSAQHERGGALRKNVLSNREVTEARQEFLEEMTKATIAGLNGEVSGSIGIGDIDGLVVGALICAVAENIVQTVAAAVAIDTDIPIASGHV